MWACVQEQAADSSQPPDIFSAHISLGEINCGLRSGKYLQGKFHPSRDNCLEAFVAVYGSEDQVHINLLLVLCHHTFNGPFSGTTRVSRYQKGKTNLHFTEARDSEWQWHQLGRMQVCTLLQIDNHASTPPYSFYRPDALPADQPTASKH